MEAFIWITVHALLMAIGWLFLIPVGVYIATVGKRSPSLRDRWFPLHQTVMLMAACTILTGAIIALLNTDPHFARPHQILGPLLNFLLVGQVMAGLFLHWSHTDASPAEGVTLPELGITEAEEEPRYFLGHGHRILGLLLYIGGYFNASVGLYDYLRLLQNDIYKLFLSMAFGSMIGIQLIIAYSIFGAWWLNSGYGCPFRWCCRRQDQEISGDGQPLLNSN